MGGQGGRWGRGPGRVGPGPGRGSMPVRHLRCPISKQLESASSISKQLPSASSISKQLPSAAGRGPLGGGEGDGEGGGDPGGGGGEEAAEVHVERGEACEDGELHRGERAMAAARRAISADLVTSPKFDLYVYMFNMIPGIHTAYDVTTIKTEHIISTLLHFPPAFHFILPLPQLACVPAFQAVSHVVREHIFNAIRAVSMVRTANESRKACFSCPQRRKRS